MSSRTTNYSQDIIWIMIRDDMAMNNNLDMNTNPPNKLNSINNKE